jgi:hypothetical protein
MMPNGCLGSPVLVLLFGLDRGFLMDVGPKRAIRGTISVERKLQLGVQSLAYFDVL